MPIIEHVFTRDSQPQDFPAIAEEFASSCVSAISGWPVDLVSRTYWAWPTTGVSQSGRFLGSTSETSVSLVSDSGLVIPTGSQFTMLYVNDGEDDSSAATLSIGSAGSAGTAEFNCYLRFTDGRAYFRWAGSTTGSTSVDGAVSSSRGIWILSTGPAGMQIWRNGALVASNSASPSRTSSSTALSTAIGSSRPQRVPLLAFFNRQLHSDQVRRLSANPWQLFEPRRIWVPVAASAGSHDATGSMSSDSATLSGSATHLTLHPSSGALSSQDSAISGAALRYHQFSASGSIESAAATIAGAAARSTVGSFSAIGSLIAQDATLAGSAAHLTLHVATGALQADDASISGQAVDETTFVPERPKTGAGRPSRRRVVVEIDGEDFFADSAEEAQALLDQAKEAAEEKAKLAIERATKANKRPVRKVMADARKALELPTISAPGLEDYAEQVSRQIEEVYESAIRTIEVAALLRKREQEELDDEDVLLLL